MRVTHRVASLLVVGMFALSSAAKAQVVSYYTTGEFTSLGANCNDLTEQSVATCTGPGGTLTFTGAGSPSPVPISVLSPTSALFGNFFLSSGANVLLNPGDVTFRLFIHQTVPSTGVATTIGSITGSITTVGGVTGSTLIWSPTPQDMSIGAVNYHLVFDQGTQGFEIPAAQNKSINGTITSTPEPGTTALFATGLAGLIPVVVRRRRKSAK